MKVAKVEKYLGLKHAFLSIISYTILQMSVLSPFHVISVLYNERVITQQFRK